MFYVKNCKNDALLMVNLQPECFFDTRNPHGTLFRAGSPMGTNTPVYYLVHENPYQRSCWGKKQFPELYEVPGRFKKIREACRKNFHLVAPPKTFMVTSYDPNTS